MSDSVYVTIYNRLNESTIETVKKVLAEVSETNRQCIVDNTKTIEEIFNSSGK